VLPDGKDADWQFVHEDDVVEAISRLLTERRGGIYNLTADGTIKLTEAAAIAGLKVRKWPEKLYRRIAAASWKLRLPNAEAPPGQIEFVLHPWIASNEKLKADLNWTPRYTSRETFELTMRAKGVGPATPAAAEPTPAPAPPPATPVA
jgi:UDP-glucose 4-epimerase